MYLYHDLHVDLHVALRSTHCLHVDLADLHVAFFWRTKPADCKPEKREKVKKVRDIEWTV